MRQLVIILTTFTCVYYLGIKEFVAYRLSESIYSKPEPLSNKIGKMKYYFELDPWNVNDSSVRFIEFTSKIIAHPKVSLNIKRRFFEITVKQMTKQIKKHPKNSKNIVIFGQFLFNSGLKKSGIRYLEKAVELAPNKEYMVLALKRANSH